MQVNFWYLTMDNRANIVTVPCSLLVDLAIIYLQPGGFRPSWWGVEASGNPTLNILLATPSFAIALIWAFYHHQAPKLWVCVLILVLTWKARTRLGGCCTRVWRSLIRLPTRRCCVWVFFVFFFFLGFAPTRLRFTPNWANSARIGLYRPYWSVSAGNRDSRNRTKLALNLAGKAKIPTLEAY